VVVPARGLLDSCSEAPTVRPILPPGFSAIYSDVSAVFLIGFAIFLISSMAKKTFFLAFLIGFSVFLISFAAKKAFLSNFLTGFATRKSFLTILLISFAVFPIESGAKKNPGG